MRITKEVWGHTVELEFIKVKDFNRHTLFQVYKVENDKLVPTYQESFTDDQIKRIVSNGYKYFSGNDWGKAY